MKLTVVCPDGRTAELVSRLAPAWQAKQQASVNVHPGRNHTGADVLIWGGDITNGASPSAVDEYAHVWQKRGHLRIYSTTVEANASSARAFGVGYATTMMPVRRLSRLIDEAKLLTAQGGPPEQTIRIAIDDDALAERRNETFQVRLWSTGSDDFVSQGERRLDRTAEVRTTVTIMYDEPTQLAAIGSGFVIKTQTEVQPLTSAGQAVSAAGDINRDGIADFMIGAPGAGDGAGKVYLVYGSRNIGTRMVKVGRSSSRSRRTSVSIARALDC